MLKSIIFFFNDDQLKKKLKIFFNIIFHIEKKLFQKKFMFGLYNNEKKLKKNLIYIYLELKSFYII